MKVRGRAFRVFGMFRGSIHPPWSRMLNVLNASLLSAPLFNACAVQQGDSPLKSAAKARSTKLALE